jgi:hypothetical protein
MSAPRPITDSPWFWAYLFTTAALIALALIGPKYSARQSQIEQQFQGRQGGTQSLSGELPRGPLSTTERTLITLQPLFLLLAGITMIAWIVFWRTHRARYSHHTDP